MASRLIGPTIIAVITAAEVGAPPAPRPRSVWERLEDTIVAGAAFVLLTRREFRYTLAIDPDWLDFTREVQDEQGHCALDGIDLPRRVIKAVVEGWPEDWMRQPDRTCSVSLTTDRIPHIALTS